MKLLRGELTRDIIQLGFSNDFTLSTTPFGAPPGVGVRYIKSAVKWKGARGIEAVEKINKKVAEGLRKAIEISKKAAGVTGTVVYKGIVMPAKAKRQIELAGKA